MASFDDKVARLLGKRVIVGITYLEREGPRHHQFHGTVVRAVEDEAIYVQGVDDEYSLPPEPEAFQPAPPGRYTMKETGEVVDDPDLMARWTVHPPDERG